MDFTQLFVDVDDFDKSFEPELCRHQLADGIRRRRRDGRLTTSEMMTILIAFQTSHFRTFKHFYRHLLRHHRHDFPDLVCYERFVSRIPTTTLPLFAYLVTRCLGPVTGISFIDSTAIKVCRIKRTRRHRVFENLARIGKTSMGWFFGFKLHLIINEHGDLLAFAFTTGNVDDRKPVESMTRRLWGKLFGDKGYISQALFERLMNRGVKLITHARKNMKNKLMTIEEKLLLRKRSLIETAIDQLKNVCQIEHTRHRSPANFFVNLLTALIAYTQQPKKPKINFDLPNDLLPMTFA